MERVAREQVDMWVSDDQGDCGKLSLTMDVSQERTYGHVRCARCTKQSIVLNNILLLLTNVRVRGFEIIIKALLIS
jgi:hypothetical protein